MARGMAKSGKSTWMPKGGGKSHRSSSSGKFVTAEAAKASPSTTIVEKNAPSYVAGAVVHSSASSVSRRFSLPNGGVISSVRSDVLDRALSRGDFKKK